MFRGSSSSLEALTCFISFRAVNRHFWWRPASFLLRNPIPIPLIPALLTYGRFPSIPYSLFRSSRSLPQLISEGFSEPSNGSVQIPFRVKFPEFSFRVQKISFWGFNLFGNIVRTNNRQATYPFRSYLLNEHIGFDRVPLGILISPSTSSPKQFRECW